MRRVGYKELLPNWDFLPSVESTQEIEPLDDFVGQERAREALDFGIRNKSKGYNIFVSGPTGTGRRTFVERYLKEYAKLRKKPNDLAYVYNFDDPSSPKALMMPAGMGKRLRKDMQELVVKIHKALKRAFDSDEYSKRKAEIEDKYTRLKNELWEKLKDQGKSLGFSVQITSTGILTVPVIDGKPVTPELYEVLPAEKRKEIEENTIKMKHLVEGALYRSRKLDEEMKENIDKLNKDIALFAVGGIFEDLKNRYKVCKDVTMHIERVKGDVLENIEDLRSAKDENIELYKIKYSINLIVDHSDSNGAPVVYEQNPTFSNLFGKVEYTSRMGVLITDFTMIKGGAIHKANGGYLIIDAERLLHHTYAWDGLKRILQSGYAKIENLESAIGLSNMITIQPEPVPVDVKVILVGTPYIYNLLYELDEDFRKLFKIKAEFDVTMNYNKETAKAFVSFLEHARQNVNAPKINKSGIRAFLWYSNRLSGSREKLSSKFGKIEDLLNEAAEFADGVIGESQVYKAYEQMEKRVKLYQEKLDEMIKNYDLMIDTEGKKVGQINGLTVVDVGDHSFGIPAKITSNVFMGKSGIFDIQREADLSGKIHSKAVFTLESFFMSRYAKKFAPTIGISISFEQVYSTVEGDSASLAETLAVISAIAGIPIRQDIAVTGSINQFGEVQPVGGVTEKVEGFFRTCKLHGLTGTQGVIIPESNLKNLVLKPEVLQAVKEGKFHIYTVKNVDEAIEILMEKKAGKLTKRGNYPKGTVNRAVLDTLQRYKVLSEGKEKRKK